MVCCGDGDGDGTFGSDLAGGDVVSAITEDKALLQIRCKTLDNDLCPLSRR